MNGVNDRIMRAVTHYDVSERDCAQAMDALEEALAETAGSPQLSAAARK
jgi:hypothetical protein